MKIISSVLSAFSVPSVSILALLLAAAPAFAADEVPDFGLLDVGRSSPRRGQVVSPRDYKLQVSAFYFASATCSYCQAQFGYLSTIQKELREMRQGFNIEILGVNRASDNSDFANSIMSIGRALPWLQDTTAERALEEWGITDQNFRDVRIVDPYNRQVAVYNLTQHSLEFAANRDALKTLLLSAAAMVDADQDRLPDPWEELFLTGVIGAGADAEGDPDGDGYNNFFEFAFGSDPADGTVFPAVSRALNSNGEFTVAFPRWGGTLIEYTVETSTNLVNWIPAAESLRASVTNLCDGTGRTLSSFSMNRNSFVQPSGFIRLNAKPKR